MLCLKRKSTIEIAIKIQSPREQGGLKLCVKVCQEGGKILNTVHIIIHFILLMLFLFFPVDFTLIYKFITNHFVAYIKKKPSVPPFFLLISKGTVDYKISTLLCTCTHFHSPCKFHAILNLIFWQIREIKIYQKTSLFFGKLVNLFCQQHKRYALTVTFFKFSFQEIINLLRCYFLLSFYLVLPLRVYVTVFGYHVSISCKADPKLKLKFAILMFSFKMIQNITNKNKMFNSCSMR